MDHFMVSNMVGVTSYNKNEIQLQLLPQNTVCVMTSWFQSPVSSLFPHGMVIIL